MFREGYVVILKNSTTAVPVPVGTKGTVKVVNQAHPPTYDIEFLNNKGVSLGTFTTQETDLELFWSPRPVVKLPDEEKKEILKDLNYSEKKYTNEQKEEILNAIQDYKSIKSPKNRKTKTWRTRVLFSENPTRKNIIMACYVWPSFPLIFLSYYTLDKPSFFPSPSWDHVGQIIALIPTIVTAVLFLRALTSERLKGAGQKRLTMLMGAMIIIFGVWLLFRAGLVLGLAHFYTDYAGHEYSQVIAVTKSKRTIGRYNSLRCLDSPELNQGEWSQICISWDEFKAMPQQFYMTLLGKQSYFGIAWDLETSYQDDKDGFGRERAEFELGLRYAQGQGLARDDKEAAIHFQIAADLGLPQAEAVLGDDYLRGLGVERDEKEGIKWLRAAALQGNPEAKKILDSGNWKE